jgi:hypothetical protein
MLVGVCYFNTGQNGQRGISYACTVYSADILGARRMVI